MRRRDFLALPALAAAARAAAPSRPNIVILLADDLGTADLGWCGGEIETPNLDRLARQGLRFSQFYAYPVCSPTRAGLLTGRSPMRLGLGYTVIRPWSSCAVPAAEHFMPQTFRAAGYQTAICGKWHLGHTRASHLPNARGFDHAYGHLNGAIDYYTHEREGGLDWNRNGRSLREEGYSTDLLAAEAVAFIRNRDRNRPFFLYTPFNAPHAPLQAPQALIGKYAKIVDPKRRHYAAMVDALDTAAGRILAALDEQRVADRTIVLFLSDNGGPVNQGAMNRFRGAKASTWEGGIRVPAVLRWPGVVRPRETAQVATVLDVFPTLAAMAGIPRRNRLPLDGKDLWEQLRMERIEPREDLFFAVEDSPGSPRYAVRRQDWKLVREVRGGTVRDALFRLDTDPREKRDVAAANSALAAELAAALERWTALAPPGTVRFTGTAPAGWTAPKLWAEAARPNTGRRRPRAAPTG